MSDESVSPDPAENLGGTGAIDAEGSAADDRGINPVWLAVAAIVVIAILVAIVIFNNDTADAPVATDPAPVPTEPVGTEPITTPAETAPTEETTTTVDEPTTTAETATTATTAPPTTAPPTDDLYADAVWPWFETEVRYLDPVDAALGFAVDFLGMTDPTAGEFRAGDVRSGEVEIRSVATFTPTLVVVRQLDDTGAWWVMASSTANVEVDEPGQGDVVTDPLRVSGRSVAPEGTVEVLVRADGLDEPVLEGFVTGAGAPGELGPFGEEFDWDPPPEGAGAIVFRTTSSDDGRVLEATVIRIRFADP